jgi:uncharacterized protein
LKLNVKNLILAPVGQAETFDLNLKNEKIDEEILAESVAGQLKVTKLEEELLAQFKGISRIKIACDRCLTDFETEVKLNFAQEYALDAREADEEKLPIESFELEWREPLRQEIIASVPVKKLCRPDCKGLCPACGKDLNVEKCICKKQKGAK